MIHQIVGGGGIGNFRFIKLKSLFHCHSIIVEIDGNPAHSSSFKHNQDGKFFLTNNQDGNFFKFIKFDSIFIKYIIKIGLEESEPHDLIISMSNHPPVI